MRSLGQRTLSSLTVDILRKSELQLQMMLRRSTKSRPERSDFRSMSTVSDDSDRCPSERNRTPNRRASVVEKTTISRQIDRKVIDNERSPQL